MPPSSFQTTIFDYLRVVFHRWHWIVAVIFLSAGVAWVWVEFLVPRQYRSELKVMVWRRDPIDQGVKRMVVKEPLHRVLNTIRDKLQADRRLQNLACNLRFAVKEEYYGHQMPKDLQKALASELSQFTPEREFAVIAPGPPQYLPHSIATYLGFRHTHKIALRDVPAQIGLQGLARILCDKDLVEPADAGLNEFVILEMLEDRRPKHEMQASSSPARYVDYLGALDRWYHRKRGDDAKVSIRQIRMAAVEELQRRLLAEAESPGAGQFSDRAKRELLKELHAVEHLLDLHLYRVVSQLYANPTDGVRGWVSLLKDGLKVGAVHGNLITFRYEWALSPRHSPFDRVRNIIPYIVVRVAHAMMEQEFYTTENRQFSKTFMAIERAKKRIQDDLEAVNEKLYNLEALKEIQLSFLKSTPQTQEVHPDSPLGPGWDDPFKGLPQQSIHINRIDEFYGDLRAMDEKIAGLEAKVKGLERNIQDPKNQKRRIPRRERIEKADPPEIIALKKDLALKLVELRKLLERNTERHPFVVKLTREIEQIKGALHEYQGEMRGESENVLVEENPLLAKWKEEKRIAESELQQLHERRKIKVAFIDSEKKKAEDAIKKQRDYQSQLDRQRRLTQKLKDTEALEEKLRASQEMGEDFPVDFSVHTNSRRHTDHFEPKEDLVLLMALMIGTIAAGTVVFLLEYTDHSIKTTEDVRRHIGLPVLGTIPEFSFAAIEKTQRLAERSFLSRRDRRDYPYPRPLDEQEPQPSRHRAKVTSRKPLSRAMIVVLIAGAVLAAAALLMPWSRLSSWAQARFGDRGTPSSSTEKQSPAAGTTMSPAPADAADKKEAP